MALTHSINKPTKYGSNPLLEATGDNAATWDHDKNYVDAHEIGGSYVAWYAGLDSSGDPSGVCRITSADGLTWTKPDHGGGQNVVVASEAGQLGVSNPSVVYDPSAEAGWEYILALEELPVRGDLGLYRSADGISFTHFKTLEPVWAYAETKGIVQHPNGKWLVYYSVFHSANLRTIGVMQSATTDPAGDWYDRGPIIHAASSEAQRYCMGVQVYGDTFVGWLSTYNSTTEQMDIDLYISHDGIRWTLASEDWLPLGVATAFDDKMTIGGKSLIQVGNDWRYYYCGFATDHDGPLPFDARIGLATIGYNRIGQISGAGNFTTIALTPGAGEKLYINCDASGGGKIEVEVLESGSPKASYTQTDADDVTTDTYETEVTWSSASLPTGSEIQLKFYLDGATLYSYEVRA